MQENQARHEEKAPIQDEPGHHEDEEDDEVVQDAIPAKPIPSPRQPTRKEIEEHELTHVPYRS